MKIAAGWRVISAIEPNVFSSLSRWRVLNKRSRLFKVSQVPSVFILSIDTILRIDLRVVWKFVNIPPDQRSVTNGMLIAEIRSVIISFACFLVATKSTFLPDLAICFIAAHAWSRCAIVLLRSIMWIPFFSSKIYGAIAGFHFLFKCPKWTPASNKLSKFTLDIMFCFNCLRSLVIS